MKLRNKTAIITGGSRGIGKILTKSFLCEGARVAIAARSEKEISETVQELRSEGQLIGIPADVNRKEEVRNLMTRTLAHFDTLDILVNAAGVQGPIGPFIEINFDEWVSNIQTNLIGTVFCCRSVLPEMIRQKRGKIINFSGGGANNSRPCFSAYGVSKAAIVRFTEILSDEVKDFHIQVNAVSPGVIKTKMIDEILQAGPKRAGKEFDLIRSKSSQGFDSPELVSELVCYLASDASDWITGKVISAVWDPWREWKDKGPLWLDQDLYVLRRIDQKNFMKKT